MDLPGEKDSADPGDMTPSCEKGEDDIQLPPAPLLLEACPPNLLSGTGDTMDLLSMVEQLKNSERFHGNST